MTRSAPGHTPWCVSQTFLSKEDVNHQDKR